MKTFTFRPQAFILSITAVATLLSACADMSDNQRGAAIGAGVGALAGVAIGKNRESAAIGAGVGALGGYIWSTQMAKKKADMEKATAGTGVAVTRTADNQLKLNIPNDISFDSGRTEIKPNLKPILTQFAQGLGNQSNTAIRIIGHTDNTGSNAINNPLSVNRAASARDYLASHGVNPSRIQIDGRGSSEPVADNSGEQGRAQNRRIEIYLAEHS